jgi:hypothetical protein
MTTARTSSSSEAGSLPTEPISVAAPRASALPQRTPLGPGPAVRRPSPKALAVTVLAVLGVGAVLVSTFYRLKMTGGFLFDFRGDLYVPARAILSGRDPYYPHYLATLAAALRAGRPVSHAFAPAVYPAPSLVAAVPFALIPLVASGVSFQVLMVIAMVVGLRLLGVRDWRCMVVALQVVAALVGFAAATAVTLTNRRLPRSDDQGLALSQPPLR